MAEKSKRDSDLDGVEIQEPMAQINEALDKLPLENLLTIIAIVKQKYETRQAEARESLISEFQERAKQMGLSISDLLPSKTKTEKEKNKKGNEKAVKFRGPNGETWSGHGKPAKWIKALESEGRKREEFRVPEEGIKG